MPRTPRFEIPGVPQHVVQRGNDRNVIFRDDADRQQYLFLALHASRFHDVEINAYVLMGNHVHLLLTAARAGAVSRFMHELGSAYVGRFNHRHERTGTLWEGRYRSCLVDNVRYLWNCHRYIEFNPVRAGLCTAPDCFAWSSFRANALGNHEPLVTPRIEYLELGVSRQERCAAYRTFVARAGQEDEFALARLRTARTLGSPDFDAQVERVLGVRTQPRKRGRPKSKVAEIISEPTLFFV